MHFDAQGAGLSTTSAVTSRVISVCSGELRSDHPRSFPTPLPGRSSVHCARRKAPCVLHVPNRARGRCRTPDGRPPNQLRHRRRADMDHQRHAEHVGGFTRQGSSMGPFSPHPLLLALSFRPAISPPNCSRMRANSRRSAKRQSVARACLHRRLEEHRPQQACVCMSTSSGTAGAPAASKTEWPSAAAPARLQRPCPRPTGHRKWRQTPRRDR